MLFLLLEFTLILDAFLKDFCGVSSGSYIPLKIGSYVAGGIITQSDYTFVHHISADQFHLSADS